MARVVYANGLTAMLERIERKRKTAAKNEAVVRPCPTGKCDPTWDCDIRRHISFKSIQRGR